MALSTSNYKILLEASLKPDVVQAQIKAISDKSKLILNVQLNQGDLSKLQGILGQIEAGGNKISKLTLFENAAGGINAATIKYIDQLGNAVTLTKQINSNVKATQQHVIDIAKAESQVVKLQEQAAKLTARQKDEMSRLANTADAFLARSKNLTQNDSVRTAVNIAEQMKVAYSEGNLSKMRELNNQLTIQKAALTSGRSALENWTESMTRAIRQTVAYGLSVGALYGALAKLREGIQYISDLNKEMTNIQLVTGFSSEQTAQLALNYNMLAGELGATTIQVAQSSTEWFRQGKTIEETQSLIRSSMMMSKLANMDSAQATEYLTSIVNGFKLEAEDTEAVISRLIALDNEFATSTAEIASAMQRSSVSAQQAGVELEELASMITVVSDVTRRAPESIGEAFKTMFARYQDILAGQVDEDGLGINNVAKSLERVGISIRDTSGGFRDFSSVLDELYGKWEDINEVEQANILKAMAGIRQREILLVLLENEEKYRHALTEVADSEGLAQKRYAIYLDSVEAAQNRAKAAAEGMWQKTINSDAIKFFYDATAVIMDLVSSMGGLQTIVLAAAVAFTIYNAAAIQAALTTGAMNIQSLVSFFGLLVAQIRNGTAAMWLFNAASMANPITLIVSAVGLAITAFVIFNKSVEDLTENAIKLQNQLDNTVSNIKKLSDEKSQLGKLYEEFKNATEGSEEWYDVQSKIKDILPQVNGYYDEQGRFILKNVDSLQQLIDLKNEELDIEREKLSRDAEKSIEAESELYNELIDKIAEYNAQLEYNKKSSTGGAIDEQFIRDTEEKIEDTALQLRESELRLKKFYSSLAEEDQKVFLEASKGTEIYRILTEAVKDFQDQASKPTELPAMEIPTETEASEESRKALEDVRDMVVDMIKQQNKAKIDAIKNELQLFKDSIDQQKRAYKDLYDEEKRLRDERKESVERELEAYNDIIEAERNLLRERQRADDYARRQQENESDLGRLESQIAVLALDDSAEAVAQRLELEEEASNLRSEMEQNAADETVRLQEQALDHEAQAAQQRHDLRVQEIEDEQQAADREYEIQVRRLEDEYRAREAALQSQIDQIESYLDKEGLIVQDAMNLLTTKTSETYQNLLEWNMTYGTGIREDVVNAWNLALDAINEYKTALSGVQLPGTGSPYSQGDFYGNDPLFNSPASGYGSQYGSNYLQNVNPGNVMHAHHSGVDAGPVGGRYALNSNEEFVKMLKGEVGITPAQMDRFMSRGLPQIAQTNAGGNSIEINMPLQVAGNLDRSCLPDIESIVDKAVKRLNDNLSMRGFTRRADSYGAG